MAGDLPDWTSRTSLAPEPLATLNIAAGATLASVQLTPPDSATGLMLMVAPIGYPGTILLQGAVTGYEYLSTITIGANEGGPIPVWIPADADAPYTLTVDYPTRPGTAPQQVAVIVYAFLGGGFSGVVGSPFAPLPVTGQQGSLGAAVAVEGDQGSAGDSVQTIGQAPDKVAVASGLGIAAGVAITLLAGVAGKSIRVRKGILQITTAAGAIYALQDSSGAVMAVQVNVTSVGFYPFDGEGVVLTAGENLVLKNVFSAPGGNWTLSVNVDIG